ncbi:F-box protein At3g07870-like [Papaver somniferum]|uniref:F-box protein At3g07870-like n=1 Tax=Papaver somniferum TaxID=3469 RepID=UPI000E702D6F|nr:F-box protein At3g07870-like [Papaver somniferum]
MKRSFPAFLVNGALHWISVKNSRGVSSRVIVSFDVSREEFVDILFPERSEMYWADDCVLGVLEECLGLGIYHKNIHLIHVWLMQEYGVRASWTKRFSFSTIDITVHNEWKLIWSSTNGELLIHDGRHGKLIYDPKYHSYRVLKVHGIDDIKMQWSTPLNYLESLVSPNSIGN